MGDVVQTLPALTDAVRAFPAIRFDWAVDQSFAEVPAWHRQVENVFASAHRRWGKNVSDAVKTREVRNFLAGLRAQHYDAIVDLQGEWKSALIARLAKGTRHGLDARSAHEWGAHLSYQKRYAVPKRQHSIQRMRQLLAKALGYTYAESEVDYGIDLSRLPRDPLAIANPYLVFIHSTSWTSKVWPEFYWQDLTQKATSAGFQVVLPWGSAEEQQRSIRIAAGNDKVIVLPSLSISEKASVIARAAATVGLDTGLSHIAAACNVPSVTIYGATDPFLVGATGRHQTHVMSEFECVKCHEVECSYGKPAAFKPACFVEITPDRVWQELQPLLNSKATKRL
ncbi:MAG: heptosyltransferase [Blastocatellia bacterium]|jgi:heptosyltransferase-1|nr:heptosyltransferase [Blastocatellia bacterium]